MEDCPRRLRVGGEADPYRGLSFTTSFSAFIVIDQFVRYQESASQPSLCTCRLAFDMCRDSRDMSVAVKEDIVTRSSVSVKGIRVCQLQVATGTANPRRNMVFRIMAFGRASGLSSECSMCLEGGLLDGEPDCRIALLSPGCRQDSRLERYCRPGGEAIPAIKRTSAMEGPATSIWPCL
jgi:hypothetical protein